MSEMKVYVPTTEAVVAGDVRLADRSPAPDDATVTIIENGKPRARDLLLLVAEELRQWIPSLRVDVYSKASAGKPIEADEAKELAARARLVLTGVGD
jgi:hypothetical protein